MSTVKVLQEIHVERLRQQSEEGWSQTHDDEHHDGELALGAAAYCTSSSFGGGNHEAYNQWPWERATFKPTTPRKDLVKAGAMIVAEIERLDRASGAGSEEPSLEENLAMLSKLGKTKFVANTVKPSAKTLTLAGRPAKGDKMHLAVPVDAGAVDVSTGKPVKGATFPVTFSGWDGKNAIVQHEDGRYETLNETDGLSAAA